MHLHDVLLQSHEHCTKNAWTAWNRFGDCAMWRTWTFDRFSQFKCGETSVEVCDHSGCPSTICTEENTEVSKIVNKDWRSTISDIAGSASHMEHVCKFLGGLELVVRLWNPCASVTHWRVETESNLGCWKHGCSHPPSTLIRYVLLWLLFLKWKSSYEAINPGFTWNSGTIADCPSCDSKKSVLMLLWAVSEMLDPLHKLR